MPTGNAIQPVTPASTTPSGAAGGDLSGTYPSPGVAKINGVTISGTPAVNDVPVASSSTAAAWGLGLVQQAATPVAGYTLVNGTGTIITWTAPNDGLLHRVLVMAVLHVTSNETGGQVSVTVTIPDGTVSQKNLFSAAQNTGIFWPISFSYPQQQLVEANTAVTVAQTSALTGGAAVVWVEIWGS